MPNSGKKDLAITDLEDFRLDPELTNGKADRSKYVFFDTPAIPNAMMYEDPMLKKFMCKLRFSSEEKAFESFDSKKLLSKFHRKALKEELF
jgi:hypothetical protein